MFIDTLQSNLLGFHRFTTSSLDVCFEENLDIFMTAKEGLLFFDVYHFFSIIDIHVLQNSLHAGLFQFQGGTNQQFVIFQN